MTVGSLLRVFFVRSDRAFVLFVTYHTFIIGILFHTCTLDFCDNCPTPISNMISGIDIINAPSRYGIRKAAGKVKEIIVVV